MQVATLSVFLAATLWRSVDSSARACACFGSIDVPPSYVTPLLGLLLIASMTIRRAAVDPPWHLHWNQIRETFTFDRVGLMIPTLLGLFAIGAVVSPTVRGYCLRTMGVQSVYSDGVDVSGLEAGKRQEVIATLHNDSIESVEVIGSHNSCDCFSIDKTRFNLAGKSSATVVVHFAAPHAGPFRQRITFLLSGTRQQNVDVEILGVLLESGEEL